MATALSDLDTQKKNLFLRLLTVGRKDGIANISDAINKTFFSPTCGGACTSAPRLGGVFLTSAAVATRGNLTEKFLFCDDGQPPSDRFELEASPAEGSSRWVRGVLILSSTLLPPTEPTFLNRQGNGRLIFNGVLHLRVVGVSLREFNPRKGINLGEGGVATWSADQWSCLHECERCFLFGLEACLLWLLRFRQCKNMEQISVSVCNETPASTERRGCGGNGSCPVSHFPLVFDEHPPTLSVPIYYLLVRINDDSSSRLADVIDVSASFMDIVVDAEVSGVKRTTALLQELVRLSSIIEEGAQSAESHDNNKRSLDQSLYALYRRVTLLIKSTYRHSTPVEKSVESTVGVENRRSLLPGAAVPSTADVSRVGLWESPSKDWPVDMGRAPHHDNDEGDDDDNNNNDGLRDSSMATKGGSLSFSLPFPDRRVVASPHCPVVDDAGNDVMPHPLPGVLVHCMKGVSRSPSVIMAYYMHKCRTQFYLLSRIPHTPLYSGIGDIDPHKSDTENPRVFSFLRLLHCLQEVRPVVNPQICFIVELRSLWDRLSSEEEKREAKQPF